METISRSLLTFLLNSLWQIPLAAAVAALACRLMRNGPASHRHAVWVAALAAAILLPLASMRQRDHGLRPRNSRPRWRRRWPPRHGGFRGPSGSRPAAPARAGFPNDLRSPEPRRPFCWAPTCCFVLLPPCPAGLGVAPHRADPPGRAAAAIPEPLDRVLDALPGSLRPERRGAARFRAGFGPGDRRTRHHPSGIPAGRDIGGRAHHRGRARNGAHRAARFRLQPSLRSALSCRSAFTRPPG